MKEEACRCARCDSEQLIHTGATLCPACQLDAILAISTVWEEDALPSIPGVRVLEKVGEGGMGIVYRVERTSGSQQVLAAKVLRFSGLNQSEATRRFEQEIEALIRIDHPQVARFIDSGLTAAGERFYLMEWVEGVTLRQYLSNQTLSSQERFLLVEQICASVAACHDVEIVHRDLHPENILINKNGSPKLVDFGVAKFLEEEDKLPAVTCFGAVVGHPYYLSPEQITFGRIQKASDVFVLGILFFEILGDHHPFSDPLSNEGEGIKNICDSLPYLPDMSSFPKDVRAVFGKALEKEASDRYSDAKELGDDLRKAMLGLPVEARNFSLSYRVTRCLTRNLRMSLLIMSSFLVLTAAMLFHFRREQQSVEAEYLRDARHYFETGQLAGQRGQWQKALSDFRKAVELDRDSLEPRFYLMDAALASGDLSLAQAVFEKCEKLQKTPEEKALLLYWQAMLVRGKADLDSAMMILKESLQSGLLPLRESLLARAILVEDPAEGLPLLDQVLAQNPFDRQALTARSLLLLLSGHSEGAVTSLEQALKFFPEDTELPILTACALARAGQIKKAQAIADKMKQAGDEEGFKRLVKAIRGLEVGGKYYEAAWRGNSLKQRFELNRLLLDLSAVTSNLTYSHGLSSLHLHQIARIPMSDLEAIKTAYFSRLDKEQLNEQLDELLKQKPMSVLGVSLTCGILLNLPFKNPEDEELALRFCSISERMLELSSSTQLQALNLEFAAVARFVHGKLHDNSESKEIALSYVRRRLSIPILIAKDPLFTMSMGANLTEDYTVRSELLQRRLELSSNDKALILDLCELEIEQRYYARAIERLKALLAKNELKEEFKKRAEKMEIRAKKEFNKTLSSPQN